MRRARPGRSAPRWHAGHLLGLDAARMTNAIGIAGSLAGGLLEFARGDGGTVKRLHLGRASEAGVLAASLAAAGFAGPRTMIEGEFGFLRVFCTEFDESHLTRGLGSEYVTLSTVLKRYPCHATAHAAVRAVRDLQAEHGFSGDDVEAITVTGNRRMIERHNILEPADLMLAQYSIPFCVALALYREARDPESYDESALADPAHPRADAQGAARAGDRGRRPRRDGQHRDRDAGRRPAFRAAREQRPAGAGRTGGQIHPPDPRRSRRGARRRALSAPATSRNRTRPRLARRAG